MELFYCGFLLAICWPKRSQDFIDAITKNAGNYTLNPDPVKLLRPGTEAAAPKG